MDGYDFSLDEDKEAHSPHTENHPENPYQTNIVPPPSIRTNATNK